MNSLQSLQEYDFEETFRNLPIIQAGRGVYQGRFHEFDVYNHTLEVVRGVKSLSKETPSAELVIGAYLHDIGKPGCATPKIDEEGKIRYHSSGGIDYTFGPNHDKVGRDMVANMPTTFFNQYKLDQEYITRLVDSHDIPLHETKKMRKTSNLDDFMEAWNSLDKTLLETALPIEELAILFWADCLGKGTGLTDREELEIVYHHLISPEENNARSLYEVQKQEAGHQSSKWYSVKAAWE
jgi:putative nucleotidyltransferase with HDIG domain